MPLQQDPTGDTSNNQNARCDSEQCALFAEFMGFSEFRKVAVAGAARTEMIEPLFSLVERHRSRSDSLQNVLARTPAASRIWKLLDQTTAKCVQESLFVFRGISSCVQNVSPLPGSQYKVKKMPAHLFKPRVADFFVSTTGRYSPLAFPNYIRISSVLVPRKPLATSKCPSTNNHIGAPAKPFSSIHPCCLLFA